MKAFLNHPLIWFFLSLLLLGACAYLPLRIKDDALRQWVMRWVLVPVSLALILYAYPVGIEIFKKLALTF